MRALTLSQPLASLVAIGAKRMDARPWPSTYSGLLAIHAGGRLTELGREVALWGPVHKALAGAGLADPEALPLGAIVGVVEVLEARRIRIVDLAGGISPWERQLGTYRPGCSLFRFGQAWLAPVPIAAPGRPGLWDWAPQRDLEPWWPIS